MARILSVTLSLIAVFGLWNCESTGAEKSVFSQGAALRQKGLGFNCELQYLAEQSRNLWDSVAYSLDRELPTGIPPDERKNMVEIRNAGLIRMFEAYAKLPPAVQGLVDEAERKDGEIAGRMRALNDSLKQHDLAVGLFLETVEESQPDSLPVWLERLTNYDCDSPGNFE